MTNFILYVNPTLTLACVSAGDRTFCSLDTAAQLTDVRPEILRHYCQLGLLGPDRATGAVDPLFDDSALYEVRRIEHYRRHEGVNLKALPMICALWREVDRLQQDVRFLRSL